MALIECPECGRRVSNKAESCPGCGAPLRAQPDFVNGRRVQTIERTSKEYKFWQLVGGAIVLVGGAIVLGGCVLVHPESVNAVIAGLVVTLLGSVVFVVAALDAWWHHG